MNKMIIGISGKTRVGKDTVAAIYQEIYSEYFDQALPIFRLAQPIYDEAKIFYKKHRLTWRKNRRLLEGMGEAFNQDWYKKEDKLIHLFNQKFEKGEFGKAFIVPDVRKKSQADWFKERGTLIRIEADSEVIEQRCTDLGEEFLQGHYSNTELDNYDFDFIITNNGSEEDLVDKVTNILKKGYVDAKYT